MDEKQKQRYDMFNNTVIVVSRTLARDLERLTLILNTHLPSTDGERNIDLKSLPEYQKAIKAIIDYRAALLEEIRRAYKGKE